MYMYRIEQRARVDTPQGIRPFFEEGIYMCSVTGRLEFGARPTDKLLDNSHHDRTNLQMTIRTLISIDHAQVMC